MTFKCIFVMGESRLPGFAPFYSLCHIPIDNVILAASGFSQAPKLKVAWSRLESRDTYMECQHWIRKEFAGSLLLAAEFKLRQKTAKMT